MRMNIKKKLAALASGTVVAASLMVAPAAGAATTPGDGEAVSPDAYCAEEYWTNTSVSYSAFKQSYTSYSSTTGGPGVTLTIQVNRTYGVSGDISGELSGDVSAILAGVSAKVGTRVGASFSAANTVSGSWTVPSTYTNGGKLALGSKRAHGKWSRQMLNRNCNVVTLRSGSYALPRLSFHFEHSRL